MSGGALSAKPGLAGIAANPAGGGRAKGGRRASFACTPCEKVERSRAMRWSHALERRLQTLFQGANHEPARKARITKAHFRLGRMDIDIDLARIAIEKQDKGWMPPCGT